MKVRYHGPDIGVDCLRDGHEYEVLRIDAISDYLAVVDESGEDLRHIHDAARSGAEVTSLLGEESRHQSVRIGDDAV